MPHSPSRPRIPAMLICLVLTLACVFGVGVAAQANPRLSGRIVKIVPQKRLVVLQRANGTSFSALLRADAKYERMGTGTQLTQFHVGDYAVVEVVGALNDTPLDGVGLFDVYTAGQAPAPSGSVDTSIQGGHAIPGGSAAQTPWAHDNPVPAVAGGGGQNAAAPNYVPYWNPTQPWEGVPTQAGQSMAPPIYRSPVMQTTPAAHATGTAAAHAEPPAAPVAPVSPAFPATPQGGTMTAAPSPAGNPWLGQAVSRAPGPASPVVSSPPVTTTRQMPVTPRMPSPVTLYDDGTGSMTSAAHAGLEVVTLQGSVTQIAAAQRILTLQTMTGGQTSTVQVRIPPQVSATSSRTQRPMGLESIRVGDYVMLSGIQMMPGAVEARNLFVNQ